MGSKFRKFLVGGLSGTTGAGLACYFFLKEHGNGPWFAVEAKKCYPEMKRELPSREDQIKSLQSEEFDVVIIGGGATGSGCALDAVTRGLRTALIEGDDFASGSSGRSTKLIHGGVRYLQKAIMHLDYYQYKMVKEALRERANILRQAPHLTHPLPIILPVYRWWQVPYFWFGIKMYDVVAGFKTIKLSYFLSKKKSLEIFPLLKSDKLCGGIVYYDGQMDDCALNLAIAITAARYGATVVNHVSVTGIIKEKNGDKEVICGVEVEDEITGDTWKVPAKCVINATGAFTDNIRKMDDPSVKNICSPSSGVHITLPGYYSPEQMGLLDPSTSDGRVIFFLPWQNHTIAGTTDLPCEPTHCPEPTEDEIRFILQEIKNYLSPDVEVRRGDVLSAWSGIRPLVSDPNKPDTQSLARNHIVHVSPSGLVTIAGGKWTTYRSMASDTIDKAIVACGLTPQHMKCQTRKILMVGAHDWTPTMYIRLVQDFGLDCEVAQHLVKCYGDRAFEVAELASLTGKRWPIIGKKIHPEFPYIDAEVRYGVCEYALTAIDMISRRLRLAYLNVEAALEALPGIVDIMAEELGWSDSEKQEQINQATEFLQTEMGQNVNRASLDNIPVDLSKDEIQVHLKRFQTIDKDSKGYVSVNDIKRSLKHHGEKGVPDEELHEILNEIDTSMNGQIRLDEYLQMMSAIKSGRITYLKFARADKPKEVQHEKEMLKKRIPVERSGGGL